MNSWIEPRADSYELLITADQQMPFQQNFTRRHISVLILTTNSWAGFTTNAWDDVNQAVNDPGRDQITELGIR